MAEHDATANAEATKKRLADERQARDKARAEQHDALAGTKPTPTQEENDLAASGVHVIDKEPDGSPPDPGLTQPGGTATRQSEAKPAAASRGAYPTRTVTPSSHSQS